MQTKIANALKAAKDQLQEGAHSADQTGSEGEDNVPLYWDRLMEFFEFQEEKRNRNATNSQQRRQAENDVIGEHCPLGPGQLPFRTSTTRPAAVDASVSRNLTANAAETQVIEVARGGIPCVPPAPAPPPLATDGSRRGSSGGGVSLTSMNFACLRIELTPFSSFILQRVQISATTSSSRGTGGRGSRGCISGRGVSARQSCNNRLVFMKLTSLSLSAPL